MDGISWIQLGFDIALDFDDLSKLHISVTEGGL
jgi:hypothetical protein